MTKKISVKLIYTGFWNNLRNDKLSNYRALDDVLEEFDEVIGLERLKAIHLNDSMNELGSHKDRHAKIGEGKIGLEAFGRIVNHEKLRSLPFYLETPNELEGYAAEIALLRGRFFPGSVAF